MAHGYFRPATRDQSLWTATNTTLQVDRSVHSELMPRRVASMRSTEFTQVVNLSVPEQANKFKVAIICAIDVESSSVLNAMDEIFEHQAQHEQDRNTYSLGKMSQRDVILIWLPNSGQDAAARSVERLGFTFPSIELALVVGVCGGVPNPSQHVQIFLGDLIVSSSIVTGDFGRQHPAEFERYPDSLTMHSPDDELRGLLHKLRNARYSKEVEEKTQQNLKYIRENKLRYAEENTTQDMPLVDELFNSEYEHPDIGFSCEATGCDRSRIVRRANIDEQSSSNVKLHFGRIGSSNALMRSGKHRDQAAAVEGLIAFEMEGAAVHKKFKTLVVKGVCDYADSHKSKSWQPRAADVAAAGCKALLSMWPR